MTLNEIQSTLDTLRIRHSNLDEQMLTTLLYASGWDDRAVHDAITLFHGRKIVEAPSVKDTSLEEKNILPEMAHIDHTLLAHNEDQETVSIEEEKQESKIIEEKHESEPQSLIVPERDLSYKKDNELPSNLPLRPFETTHHIWPFSRYKDVFYGEVMPILKKDEKEMAEKNIIEHIHLESTPLTKNDEKLIVLACTMLLVILLLLGYMYSNGRL